MTTGHLAREKVAMVSGALLLIALVAVVVLVVRASRSGAAHSPAAVWPTDLHAGSGRLADDLRRWVGLGLLSAEQADAILASEEGARAAVSAPPGQRARAGPAIAEALGYLGGILACAGLVLLVGNYWSDLATAGRLALTGAGAVGLVVAGALVREQAAPALARLRWFLWLAGTVLTAVWMRVLVVDGLGNHGAKTVAAACAGAVALESGLLWWRQDRPIQLVSGLVSTAVFAGAAAAELTSGGWVAEAGLAVWAIGVIYVALGVRRAVSPPILPEGVGAVAVVVGGAIVASNWQGFGLLLLVATAFGLLALATVPGLAPAKADQLTFGIVGGVALLEAVPSTLGYFSHAAGGITGLIVVGTGATLMLAGDRRVVRLAAAAKPAGCAAIIGGAALTGVQWHGFAPVFGIGAALGLVALGMLPGQVLLSVFGSAGLLINVPWTILHFFPGEGRAPLLIFVSGLVIVGVAVLLSMRTGWLEQTFPTRHHRHPPTGIAPGAP